MINNNSAFTANGAKNPWDYYVRNHYQIYLDTSSLMDPGFTRTLLQQLKECLECHNSWRVCIPERVIEEVQSHLRNPQKYEAANRAWGIIDSLKRAGLVSSSRAGAGVHTIGDNVLLSLIMQNMMSYPVLLVTQDGGLAAEALKIRKNLAVNGKGIWVKKVANGALQDRFSSEGNAPSIRSATSFPPAAPTRPPVPSKTATATSAPPSKVASTPAPVYTKPFSPTFVYKETLQNETPSAIFSLFKGDGYVSCGFFGRTDCYNFLLHTQSNKPMRINAYVLGKRGLKIPIDVKCPEGSKKASFTVERSALQDGRLEVVLEGEYRIGRATRKSFSGTVSMAI